MASNLQKHETPILNTRVDQIFLHVVAVQNIEFIELTWFHSKCIWMKFKLSYYDNCNALQRNQRNFLSTIENFLNGTVSISWNTQRRLIKSIFQTLVSGIIGTETCIHLIERNFLHVDEHNHNHFINSSSCSSCFDVWFPTKRQLFGHAWLFCGVDKIHIRSLHTFRFTSHYNFQSNNAVFGTELFLYSNLTHESHSKFVLVKYVENMVWINTFLWYLDLDLNLDTNPQNAVKHFWWES